jgi:hypothetical protein
MIQYRFRRWLKNWLTADQDLETAVVTSRKNTISGIRPSEDPDHEKSLNFRVWFANGGRVIQTSRYDRIKDRNISSMYVITEDQDFGHEINKIVTMESLRG